MTKFEFSEAAQLYAKHEAVVDVMYQHMKTGVSAFWDAVAAELRGRCAPYVCKRADTAGYTYLRLYGSVEEGALELASLWVGRAADGRLVRDAQVRVGIGSARVVADDGALAALLSSVDKVLDRSREQVLRRKPPTAATLFELDVSCGPHCSHPEQSCRAGAGRLLRPGRTHQ